MGHLPWKIVGHSRDLGITKTRNLCQIYVCNDVITAQKCIPRILQAFGTVFEGCLAEIAYKSPLHFQEFRGFPEFPLLEGDIYIYISLPPPPLK